MVTIYAIRCLETGRRYVGCTAGTLSKRMREHRCLLRAGTHKCKDLQADWIKYGEAAFIIEPLEGIPAPAKADVRRAAEIKWIRSWTNPYNEYAISFQPPPGAPAKAAAARVANGYVQSVESNIKRRLAQLGIPKGHGAKISATKRKRRDSLSTGKTQVSEAVDKELPR